MLFQLLDRSTISGSENCFPCLFNPTVGTSDLASGLWKNWIQSRWMFVNLELRKTSALAEETEHLTLGRNNASGPVGNEAAPLLMGQKYKN